MAEMIVDWVCFSWRLIIISRTSGRFGRFGQRWSLGRFSNLKQPLVYTNEQIWSDKFVCRHMLSNSQLGSWPSNQPVDQIINQLSVSDSKFPFVIFAFNFAAQWATVILPSEIQQCLFPCFPCIWANLLNCILAYLAGQLQLAQWIMALASPNNLGVFVWVLDVHVIVEVFHSCDMQNYDYHYYSLLWALHRIN